MVNLETTNWLLAVIAVGSAVQTLMLLGGAFFAYRAYRQLTQSVAELRVQAQSTLSEVEARHIAPLRQQVDAILTDVHRITARVSDRTERVDDAISDTMDRVDETTDRVKHTVRDKVSRAVGVARGVRAIIASLLTTDGTHEPPASARGRA